MAVYRAFVTITLKKGVLDSQGKAVASSLHDMGYGKLEEVRVGRYVELALEAASHDEALAMTESICDDLLVNDLIEERRIEVVTGP